MIFFNLKFRKFIKPIIFQIHNLKFKFITRQTHINEKNPKFILHCCHSYRIQFICSMSLNFVKIVSWNFINYHNFKQKYKKLFVVKLYYISLALHFHKIYKKNSLFHFHNITTSIPLLSDYQSKVTPNSIPNNSISSCFDPSHFVTTPNTCIHI